MPENDELLLRAGLPTTSGGVRVRAHAVDADRGRVTVTVGVREARQYQLGDVLSVGGARFRLSEVSPRPEQSVNGQVLFGPAGAVVARFVRVAERQLPEALTVILGTPAVVDGVDLELLRVDADGTIHYLIDDDPDGAEWARPGQRVRFARADWVLEQVTEPPTGKAAAVFRRTWPEPRTTST